MADPDCLPLLLSLSFYVSVSLFFFHSFWLFFRVWTECEFPVWDLLVRQWKGYCASFTFLYCLCSVLYTLLASPCLVMARHVSYLFKCHLSGLSCAFYDNIFELYERENESTFVIFLFKHNADPPSPSSLSISISHSLSRAYKLSEVFHN